MSLLLSQLGGAVTPSIVAGWTDWELPEEDRDEVATEESFVAQWIDAPAVVVVDYIQPPSLEEEVEEEPEEIWQPQLFDPWTTVDAISAAYAENDDEDALDEDWIGFPTQEDAPVVGVAPEEEEQEEDAEGWIGFWDEPVVAPPATDFITGWLDEPEQEEEQQEPDFALPGPFDDAPVVPPVLSPQALAELYGGNIFKVRKAKAREQKRKKPPLPEMVRELVDVGAKREIVATMPKKDQKYLQEVGFEKLLAAVEQATAQAKAEIRRLWMERAEENDQKAIDILLGVDDPPLMGGHEDDWILL